MQGLYEQGVIKIMTEKLTETADLNMWKLMDSEPTGSLHETDLDPLHVCDSCVSWSLHRAPSNKN